MASKCNEKFYWNRFVPHGTREVRTIISAITITRNVGAESMETSDYPRILIAGNESQLQPVFITNVSDFWLFHDLHCRFSIIMTALKNKIL